MIEVTFAVLLLFIGMISAATMAHATVFHRKHKDYREAMLLGAIVCVQAAVMIYFLLVVL